MPAKTKPPVAVGLEKLVDAVAVTLTRPVEDGNAVALAKPVDVVAVTLAKPVVDAVAMAERAARTMAAATMFWNDCMMRVREEVKGGESVGREK